MYKQMLRVTAINLLLTLVWTAPLSHNTENTEPDITTNKLDVHSLVPLPKTWWFKEISRDVNVAGRLTDTQIKYIAETGVKSIISNLYFDTPGAIGTEYLPTTDEESTIVADFTSLYWNQVLQPGESYLQVEAVRRFTSFMAEAPRPVLFHCESSYTATFIALNYLANQTVYDPDFEPKVDSAELYRRAASLGHFFNSTDQKDIVSAITGEEVVDNPPQPDVSTNWRSYWLAKPAHANLYVTGQTRSSYGEMIDNAGITTVVNLRKRVIEPPDNIPSQEEVNLLNIEDYTGTYNGTGRQSEERLLQTRIDPSKPNDYIDVGSDRNYESRNGLEFGDDIGYNEDLEQQYWEARGIEYYITSVGHEYGISVDMWNAYRDTWLHAAREGNHVLFVCAVGVRAATSALLTAGYQYGYNSTWALTRINEMGIFAEEAGFTDIVQVFQDVLDA